MKIAITGASGSIGSIVVELALKQGHAVVAIDQTAPKKEANGKDYSFVKVDLCNYDDVLEHLRGCDAVISLAAIRTPEDYQVKAHNTNVVISWNILRACAELGINRVAQASSVNVIALVWSVKPRLYYFPIDEEHPREPDEPYGISKVVCEVQADSIVRRYPSMRIASLRPSYSIPAPFEGLAEESDEGTRKDLWGWVQERSGAEAFLLAVTSESPGWDGHETFFLVAPTPRMKGTAEDLRKRFYPEVPIKEGKDLSKGFFDCSKAKRLLGWVHKE